MIDWEVEKPLIVAESTKKNVDPFFVMAIRQAENGGDGKQFGVLSEVASTYAIQLSICAATIAHRLESFPGNPLVRDPFGRIRYNSKWIAYFASIWAPVGLDIANDPNHMNKAWLGNVEAAYQEHINGKL